MDVQAARDLTAEDFAVAIVTHKDREHMLTSSRLSRQVCNLLFLAFLQQSAPFQLLAL